MGDLLGGIGNLLGAGGNIILGSISLAQNADKIKLMRDQLGEQQKMNQWEVDKYNNTLKAQKEGIGSLGAAFGSINKNNSTSSTQEQNESIQDSSIPTQRQ